jgi:DNA-binding SARP family transcriptional activator
VSEWTERPVQALEQWLFIARQTQKDDAWKAVLRLAPGLFHDAALIEALHYQLRRKPGDEELIEDLVEAYERLGSRSQRCATCNRTPATPPTWSGWPGWPNAQASPTRR